MSKIAYHRATLTVVCPNEDHAPFLVQIASGIDPFKSGAASRRQGFEWWTLEFCPECVPFMRTIPADGLERLDVQHGRRELSETELERRPAFERPPWALTEDELSELHRHCDDTLGRVHDNASRAYYYRLVRALRELRIRRAGD